MLSWSLRFVSWTGALAVAASTSTAFGQCAPFNSCCCPPIRVTACYQTVPVTEYRECQRQTVQRPVVETKYVEQPCTEYKQVVECKTAEVPTCTYQNVTEMRCVQKDCGRWVTQCYERPQVTPCQYDNRPDLFGFINRTGYAVRMAITPQTWTERVYVPNVVTTQVPVTRQVAVRGTQTVNYQVARMVPVTTTRKVAVNTVRMVCEEIVTKRPVTVFRTVPMGSSLALGVPSNSPAPTTTTALQSTPESKGTAIMPKRGNDATKITNRINDEDLNDDDDLVGRSGSNSGGEKSPRKINTQSGEQGSIKVPAATGDDANQDPGRLERRDRKSPATTGSDRPAGSPCKRTRPPIIRRPGLPRSGPGRCEEEVAAVSYRTYTAHDTPRGLFYLVPRPTTRFPLGFTWAVWNLFRSIRILTAHRRPVRIDCPHVSPAGRSAQRRYMAAPAAILELVKRFEMHRESYISSQYNETQLRREFVDPFFKALGWDVDNESGYAEAYKDVIHEDAIKIGGTTKAPDYCFRIGGTRKFFVETKKPSVNLKDDVAPAFQLRRYAWTAKLPLSILTDFEEFAVYDCLAHRPSKNDKPSKARVLYLRHTDYADRWDEIAAIFSPRRRLERLVRQICGIAVEKGGHCCGRCGISARNRILARVTGSKSGPAERPVAAGIEFCRPADDRPHRLPSNLRRPGDRTQRTTANAAEWPEGLRTARATFRGSRRPLQLGIISLSQRAGPT